MKIEKIQIKNLTSYEGEHEVDFTQEPLRSAGLFAICGDTGAGKSTLLDAVCLALYNKTPRLDGAERIDGDLVSKNNAETQGLQPDDARNFMRRGKDNAYARVIFVMPDGGRYEAEWSCRLTRNKTYAGIAQSFKCLGPKKETFSGGLKEIRQKIVDVTGLSFEQFCRTVLLAQNSFASFLKAKKDEKSELLEKLTGTEIYGKISQKVYQHYQEAKKNLALIESRIAGLKNDLLRPEQLQTYQNDWKLKSGLLKSLTNEQNTLIKKEEWLEQYECIKKEMMAAQQAYSAAVTELNRQSDQQELLNRYDSVLEIQPLNDEITLREADIQRFKSEEKALTEKIQQQHTLVVDAEKLYRKQLEDEKVKKEEWENRKNEFTQGHHLEGVKSQLETTLQTHKKELDEALLAVEDAQKTHEAVKKEYEKEEKYLAQLKQDKQRLQSNSKMYEQMEAVNYKLNDFKKTIEQIDVLTLNLKNAQKKLDEQIQLEEQYKKKSDKQQGELKTLEGTLQIEKQANAGKNAKLLQNNASSFLQKEEQLKSALQLWKLLFENFETQKELSAKTSRNSTNLSQLEKDRDAAEQEYLKLKEEYYTLNAQYLTAKSEDAVHMRKDLKEGTPCPVCGATHHPYHTETEIEVGQLIEKLGKDHQEKAEQLKAAEEKFDALKTQYAGELKQLENDRQQLAKVEQQLLMQQTEWKAYEHLDNSLKDCSSNTDGERRVATIQLLMENAGKDARTTQDELDTYNLHQDKIEELNLKIDEVKNDGQEVAQQYNHCQTNISNLQKDISSFNRQLEEKQKAKKGIYEDLGNCMTIENWWKAWEKQPEDFVKKINADSETWKSILVKIEKAEKNVSDSANKVERVKSAYQAALENEKKKRDNLSQTQGELEANREQLRRLFGSSNVMDEEQKLNNDLKTLEKWVKQKNENYLTEKEKLLAYEGEKANLSSLMVKTENKLAENTNELNIWMAKFNHSHPPINRTELTDLLSRKHWNDIRKLLDDCRKQKDLAQQRQNDMQKRYDECLAFGSLFGHVDTIVLEEVLQERAAVAAKIEQCNQELAEITRVLNNHQNSEKNAKAEEDNLQKAQHEEAEWNKLNMLFGSADGKKFREVAQRYTFDFLVAHANTQLSMFSPRYQLARIPGTLALKVIDREMCDEEHYVTSLSGGETFVVSLALALGLANLSSGGLSIGSLFIDEGFGNLDHESLDLVMMALSNLQSSQGRTVGVISHTDQIREQISPQIRVEKLHSNGRSRICIY